MPPKDFTESYLKRIARIDKKLDKKSGADKALYRFCYVNKEKRLCLNAIFPKDEQPSFVLWDGENLTTGLKEFKTPEGDLIQLPPLDVPFYRSIYKNTIFPRHVIEDLPETAEIDERITSVLKRWFILPEDHFIVARGYVKFSWVYERFRKTPSLSIYGDWGTGKTEWGTFIAWLCMYGQVVDDLTAAALVRILHNTNSTIMLDEADYIDGEESDKMRRILRNGYKRGGDYVITEAEGKIHTPKSFLVDQPKIIVKRQFGKDIALNTRMIPFEMTPRDKEIPREMRRNDEYEWESIVKSEMSDIASLLLRWRFENIFKTAEPLIIDNMKIRYNDTISPLLKLSTEQDREAMISFMRNHEKYQAIEVSDDFGIRIVKVLGKMQQELQGFLGPTQRIFVTDIIKRCATEYGEEMNENDFKRYYTSKSVKGALKNFGIHTELYRNKVFVIWDSLVEMIPKISARYGIKYGEEEANASEQLDKQAEAEALLAEHEKTLSEQVKEEEQDQIDLKQIPF